MKEHHTTPTSTATALNATVLLAWNKYIGCCAATDIARTQIDGETRKAKESTTSQIRQTYENNTNAPYVGFAGVVSRAC